MNIVAPLKPVLVRPERCERCRYAAPPLDSSPLLECRFNPPAPTTLVVGQLADGQPAIMTFTNWPRVNSDQWCGHWHIKFELNQ